MNDAPMLHDLLARAWRALSPAAAAAPTVRPGGASPGHVVFFSVTTGRRRALTVHGRGASLAHAWADGIGALAVAAPARRAGATQLRVDVVATVRSLAWGELVAELARTRRNYFPEGLAFDAAFEVALLAQELHGNAILYDARVDHAKPRPANLRVHGHRRFEREIAFPVRDDQAVWCFSTHAVYVDAQTTCAVSGDGRGAAAWGAPKVRALVQAGSDYLADQVQPDGAFVYGRYPCFDRTVPGYNTLRHASSTYALLEAWEVTRSAVQKSAIDRALARLAGTLIHRTTLGDGAGAAFLVDTGDEIKLGGNAVCLLALVKHAELTGECTHFELMTELAQGIVHMQDAASGGFVHVLHHPSLAVKDVFRTIYYDGEAAFGLMRLYGLTGNSRWLAAVERAFQHFIAARHWEAHDHWLGYCVNELTRHRPEARYFEFGLRNVADHLDFVLERITTFPTLLEMMMAAHEMLQRMDLEPALVPMLRSLDRRKFDRALEHRARYLANGFFWPEFAMFFARPDRIAGAFFIRHHGFRVRIDDVEHYLSGYVAYLRHLDTARPRSVAMPHTLAEAASA